MKTNFINICPVCFQVCETARECHAHNTLKCYVGEPGDECRKPMRDQFGNLVSRAPRWYLEALAIIPNWSQSGLF